MKSLAGTVAVETVLASQRVGAKRHPMTGSAKQSSLSKAKLDCFVASLLAMTRIPYFSPTLNGGSLPGGTVSSAIASSIATMT
jgi:hypothetical protein